jgi:peptide/nickel transport system permease protein
MRILSLAGRRLAASIPTLVLILIGVFLLLQFAPGDTVDAMMAQMGGGDAATAKELRKFYGLDLSIPAQLGNYLWRLVRLDLGYSSIYGKPVASVILERLPPTILLMTASLSFARLASRLCRASTTFSCSCCFLSASRSWSVSVASSAVKLALAASRSLAR